MSVGLKTWDTSGNLIIDTETRMSRVLGILAVYAGTSGSFSDPGFATGEPYCIRVRLNAGSPITPNNSMFPPAVAIVGTTLFYDVSAPSNDHLLIYGVF